MGRLGCSGQAGLRGQELAAQHEVRANAGLGLQRWYHGPRRGWSPRWFPWWSLVVVAPSPLPVFNWKCMMNVPITVFNC